MTWRISYEHRHLSLNRPKYSRHIAKDRFWPKAATQHLQLQEHMIGVFCEAAGLRMMYCTEPH